MGYEAQKLKAALPLEITDAQAEVAVAVAKRWDIDPGNIPTQCKPFLDGYSALMLECGPIWIGIETDGYAHS